MKTTVSKKISSLVLALAIAFTAVLSTAAPVQAATKSNVLKGAALADAYGTANAGEEVRVPFTVDKAGNVDMLIAVTQPTSTNVALYTANGALVPDASGSNPFTVSASEYMDLSSVGINAYGYMDGWTSLSAGDYIYSCTFTDAVQYEIMIDQEVAEPKLNQTSATITAGFTKKLSVTDGKAKSWSSSNKKVATVDSKGKVTAKKKGNATITVKCTDGTTLKCKITVKANEYTARKITTSDVTYGESALSPYKISFDKKGNLVIKARYVNRMSHKVVELRNIKIVVKDANGKTVGTYKQSKKKVSVSSGSTKDFTFTIKKSSLKKKKADLRGGDVDVYGTSYYYVYY